jgi:hypothetical protein
MHRSNNLDGALRMPAAKASNGGAVTEYQHPRKTHRTATHRKPVLLGFPPKSTSPTDIAGVRLLQNRQRELLDTVVRRTRGSAWASSQTVPFAHASFENYAIPVRFVQRDIGPVAAFGAR